jgi:hypothetical protein
MEAATFMVEVLARLFAFQAIDSSIRHPAGHSHWLSGSVGHAARGQPCRHLP